MYKITLAVTFVALAGCAASMTPRLPAGRMSVPADVIAPCSADRRGSQACADARVNATVISQIHTGQSQTEVCGIMGHAAERREVGAFTESWGYLTSYKNQMMTWITFTDRTVSSMTHEIVGGH
jgi:hypothetical protein